MTRILVLLFALASVAACGNPPATSQGDYGSLSGYGPRDPAYAAPAADPSQPWPRGQALMENEGP